MISEALAGAVAFGTGVEAVLRDERVACGGAAQADAENAPGGVSCEQGLRVVGDVRTGEGADAQMHDAG